MNLTKSMIMQCGSDEELFKALSSELQYRLPSEDHETLESLVERLRSLPPGLRAMAATHHLDVSITIDDLGWHFANWHHRSYCDETLRGLRELEAYEAADIFAEAYAVVLPYWERIGDLCSIGFDAFTSWYSGSELEKTLDPLTERMQILCGSLSDYGLMTYWLRYARKYPLRVAIVESPDSRDDIKRPTP